MAQLTTVIRYLDSLLQSHLFEDSSLNGLQVESNASDIKLVALAVDAGASVIDKAIAAEANLLIVHHGLFWNTPRALSGAFGAKVRNLYQGRCSLYASHLPLDAHSEVGNNSEVARYLGLRQIEAALTYKGLKIGVTGQSAAQPLEYFVQKAREMVGASTPLVLPFGKSKIEKVGIVTGSGCFAIEEVARLGLDLFFTGEPKQDAFHLAKELRLNVIFGGHYATETFGVLAVGKRMEKDLDVKTVFIDEPTGI